MKEEIQKIINNPQERPLVFNGIEQALKQGSRLHAFRSGGGLRVISLVKGEKEIGYGEHPHVEEALAHVNEDFLAGGRSYDDVYGKGKKYPHYLTGSTEPSSKLDAWLLKGCTFDAYSSEDGRLTFEMRGYKFHETPKSVLYRAKLQGRAVLYMDAGRGYTYEVTYHEHRFANDEEGWDIRAIDIPEGGSNLRSQLFRIMKSGHGKSLQEAIENAFNASEVEIQDEV